MEFSTDYTPFRDRIKEYFTSTRQSNWGKLQILEKLKDLEIEFLTEAMANMAKASQPQPEAENQKKEE